MKLLILKEKFSENRKHICLKVKYEIFLFELSKPNCVLEYLYLRIRRVLGTKIKNPDNYIYIGFFLRCVHIVSAYIAEPTSELSVVRPL